MLTPAKTKIINRSLKGKFDLLVALCALITSITSIWLSVSQGDDMQRLVQAQSWPILGFGTGNTEKNEVTGEWEQIIGFELTNLGVGPAKVKSMEIWYNDKPMVSSQELLDACCKMPEKTETKNRNTTTSNTVDRVLRAGQTINFFNWKKTAEFTEEWDRLNIVRSALKVRVCYCSVFDECWQADPRTTETKPVAQCPIPAVNFME